MQKAIAIYCCCQRPYRRAWRIQKIPGFQIWIPTILVVFHIFGGFYYTLVSINFIPPVPPVLPPPFQVKFTLQHRLKTALFPDLVLPINKKTTSNKVKSLSLDYMISDPTSMEYEEEQEKLKLKIKTAKAFPSGPRWGEMAREGGRGWEGGWRQMGRGLGVKST